MNELGIGLIALAVGLAIGALLVGLRSRPPVGDDPGARLEARLDVQAAELRRLSDAAAVRDGVGNEIRGELAGARRAIEELALKEQERRSRQVEDSEVIRRLSTVLAGGAAKGRAGENVLRDHLAQLPPSMLVTDFKVNGKVVEFGLLLPDGKRLPVDSKWPALAELEALSRAKATLEREAAARAVERVVAHRVREVAQYLDPALTAPVAVAAVPDAAYAVLRRVHAEAFVRGVVVVPYSTALPILLFLYSLVLRYGDVGDVQACLSEIASVLDAMQGVLENKMVRAATMIANGADEFRGQLGKARGSVARGRAVEPVSLTGDRPEGVLQAVR